MPALHGDPVMLPLRPSPVYAYYLSARDGVLIVSLAAVCERAIQSNAAGNEMIVRTVESSFRVGLSLS